MGDIHTKSWIITEVERIVDHYDAVVFVGDYADNWNAGPGETMSTWRNLKLLMQDNPKVHAVIGNHDYAYLHPQIAGRSSGFNPITNTLINAPENKRLKNWLLSLPPVLGLDGITFSHAGLTEEWDGDDSVMGLWNDTSPIWARPKEFGGHTTYKNITQVIGHNSSEKIWQPQENIWCIDTFSQKPNRNIIGDETVLEIVDGKKFNVLKLKEIYENNNNTTNIEDDVS